MMKKWYWSIALLIGFIFPSAAYATAQTNSVQRAPMTTSQYDAQLKAAHFVGTALILKDQHIILAKGYGAQNQALNIENSVDTKYQIGSIQKAWTAALIGQLISQHKLRFSTSLATFYPQIPHSNTVTIKQMLDMVSGLHLTKKPTTHYSETELLDYYISHTTYKTPKKFVYSPINYHLLAGIIQQLTHMSYWDALRTMIVEPYHLTSVTYYPDWLSQVDHSESYKPQANDPYQKLVPFSFDTYQKELGTGNIGMNITDLATFYRLYFHHQFFSKQVAAELFAPLYQEAYASGIYNYKDYYRARGEIQQQQILALMTPDTHDLVILMSNAREDTSQMNVIGSIFSELTQQSIDFK